MLPQTFEPDAKKPSKAAGVVPIAFEDGDLLVVPARRGWDRSVPVQTYIISTSKLRASCPAFLKENSQDQLDTAEYDPGDDGSWTSDVSDTTDATAILTQDSKTGDSDARVKTICCSEPAPVIQVLLASIYNRMDLLDISKLSIFDRIDVWKAAIKYDCPALILYAESSIL